MTKQEIMNLYNDYMRLWKHWYEYERPIYNPKLKDKEKQLYEILDKGAIIFEDEVLVNIGPYIYLLPIQEI